MFTDADPEPKNELTHPRAHGQGAAGLLLEFQYVTAARTTAILARPAVTWCSSTRGPCLILLFCKRTLLSQAWPAFSSLHSVG